MSVSFGNIIIGAEKGLRIPLARPMVIFAIQTYLKLCAEMSLMAVTDAESTAGVTPGTVFGSPSLPNRSPMKALTDEGGRPAASAAFATPGGRFSDIN